MTENYYQIFTTFFLTIYANIFKNYDLLGKIKFYSSKSNKLLTEFVRFASFSANF